MMGNDFSKAENLTQLRLFGLQSVHSLDHFSKLMRFFNFKSKKKKYITVQVGVCSRVGGSGGIRARRVRLRVWLGLGVAVRVRVWFRVRVALGVGRIRVKVGMR